MIKTCSCIAYVVHGAWMVPKCLWDSSALVPNCLNIFGRGRSVRRTLRHQCRSVSTFYEGAEVSNGHFGTGAELSWVRNVQGPKCPYTVYMHRVSRRYNLQECESAKITTYKVWNQKKDSERAYESVYKMPMRHHYSQRQRSSPQLNGVCSFTMLHTITAHAHYYSTTTAVRATVLT